MPDGKDENEVPELSCPLTLELMEDPVICSGKIFHQLKAFRMPAFGPTELSGKSLHKSLCCQIECLDSKHI